MNTPKHTWPIYVTEKEVFIKSDSAEWFSGDRDSMTPEEWRETRLIAAAPALLKMVDLFLKEGALTKNLQQATYLLAWVNSKEEVKP